MKDYYSDKLSAERLKKCYEIASPRVQQYLKAEVDHVLQKIKPADMVLELGCGYGRVLGPLAGKARLAVGIDTSVSSILFSQEEFPPATNCLVMGANALCLPFGGEVFDVVVCIQNGISAFHVDQRELIRESLRVTRKRGIVLFSSYSDKFWGSRLEWFEAQAEAGLLGEIDYSKTGGGRIVCMDGFTVSTVGPERFLSLISGLRGDARITEVDESSLFCEIIP